MKRWLPEGTRLILASEELLEQFGTRTERGDKITAEWGEQQPKGWYEPIFTVHHDDNLVDAARARLRERVDTLPVMSCKEWALAVMRAIDEEDPRD